MNQALSQGVYDRLSLLVEYNVVTRQHLQVGLKWAPAVLANGAKLGPEEAQSSPRPVGLTAGFRMGTNRALKKMVMPF